MDHTPLQQLLAHVEAGKKTYGTRLKGAQISASFRIDILNSNHEHIKSGGVINGVIIVVSSVLPDDILYLVAP